MGLFNFFFKRYDERGFDEYGINKYTGTKYDKDGYGKDGYNKDGWDKCGYNKETNSKYDKEGYNKNGYDKDGYDKNGYNERGYDKDGYDRNGYDPRDCLRTWHKSGINRFTGTKYNERGYDRNGYDKNGYNERGYDKDGYDKNGFDYFGWSKQGINKETGTKYNKKGFDEKGYNKDGFNSWGYNKITDSYYDKEGYDISGFNGFGFDRNGYRWDGYNLEGFDKNGYKRDGYNIEGFDRNGFDKNGYDKNGLDYYGNSKETKKLIKKNDKTLKENKSPNKQETYYNSLKICSIASGSNGNCYYIGTDNDAILIDDGISYKQLSLRMKEANLDINSIKGIFISHEHVDHVRGLPIFYKNHPNVPIYFNKNAYCSINKPIEYRSGVVNLEERVVNLAGFKIYPFKKKHDASYPLSFRVEYNGISVGVFTDIGEHSTKFRNHFSKCDAVFLEANHDVVMLRNCSRPRDVINRIYETHFSNDNAYDMLNDYANPNLKFVILVHISEDNNSYKKILEKFAKFEKKYKLEIASRHAVGEVHEISIND